MTPEIKILIDDMVRNGCKCIIGKGCPMHELGNKLLAALALPAEPPQARDAFEMGRAQGIEDCLDAVALHIDDWPKWDCDGACKYGTLLKKFSDKVAGALATPCPECKRSDGRHEEGCTWDASATPAPTKVKDA